MKEAKDTKAVQAKVAEVKAEGRETATPAPKATPKPAPTPAENPVEEMNKAAKALPENQPTLAANKGKTAEPAKPLTPEEDMKRVDLLERVNAQEREERLQKAAELAGNSAEDHTEAMLNSQSGEGGKLMEPNFQSEAHSHNALTAIETARLNEPDYVDAARRPGGALKELINTQDDRPRLVGKERDHELTDVERASVEILRSRAEMRDTSDPKNTLPKDIVDEKGEKDQMNAHRKEVEKAEKAHEKELKELADQREKDQADQEKEHERLRKQNEKEMAAVRKAAAVPPPRK